MLLTYIVQFFFEIQYALHGVGACDPSILMAILPGGPGLADTRMSPFWLLLELRMMEVVVTT